MTMAAAGTSAGPIDVLRLNQKRRFPLIVTLTRSGDHFQGHRCDESTTGRAINRTVAKVHNAHLERPRESDWVLSNYQEGDGNMETLDGIARLWKLGDTMHVSLYGNWRA